MEVHGTEDKLSRWNGDPYNNDGWGADIAIPRAVGLWAAVNRCTHEQTEVLPLIKNKIIAHRYVGGTDGNQVWLYEVVGGKHNWASDSMDTAAEVWKFFSLYLK
jgi:polyhydroxybutyrate depolymerase